MKRTLLVCLFACALALPAALAAPVDYLLNSAASRASFAIGENLLGRETTAVGTTAVVEGGVTLDAEDPSVLVFHDFQVDVSTLTTDDRQRDGQIRNRILQTSDAANQYVTFVPREAVGLELPLVPGVTQSVELVGQLTIKGVTKEAVFELELQVLSDTELRGVATTVVWLEDFGLSVPRVPLVARVDEFVTLALDFHLVASP